MTATVHPLRGASYDPAPSPDAGMTVSLVIHDWGLSYPLSPAVRLMLSPNPFEDTTRSMDMKRAAGFLVLCRDYLARGETLRRMDARAIERQRWGPEDVASSFSLPDALSGALVLIKKAAQMPEADFAHTLIGQAHEVIMKHANELESQERQE